jgi:hypothetical protein
MLTVTRGFACRCLAGCVTVGSGINPDLLTLAISNSKALAGLSR